MNVVPILNGLFCVLAEAGGEAARASQTLYPVHLYTGIGACIGAGIVCLAAALGIGRIATRAVESIARQPEVSGDIRGAMLLTCAFVEGVCLFAVVVTLLAVTGITTG